MFKDRDKIDGVVRVYVRQQYMLNVVDTVASSIEYHLSYRIFSHSFKDIIVCITHRRLCEYILLLLFLSIILYIMISF